MSSDKKIFIIGGGQAAIYAASEIRKLDKEASIYILGEENSHPYERPPLSKDFLLNLKQENEFLFFSESFFEEQNINYINEKIEKVNFQNKELVSKIAADIKNLKPVEPYKAKGIKEKGQFVLRKEGKKK